MSTTETPLLPVGVQLERMPVGQPDGFVIRTDRFCAEYGLRPVPFAEHVRADVSQCMASEDVDQLIAVLADAGWVR